MVRAQGVYLYTEDGRRILDGISSWWVNVHGHSNPKLNEALAAQARELERVVFAGCTHRPAVRTRRAAARPSSSGVDSHLLFRQRFHCGCQYWQNRGQPKRRTFLTLHHAYHGDTVDAMSASEDSVFTRAFTPLLFPVVRAHPPYC